jgi:hypothetical protein
LPLELHAYFELAPRELPHRFEVRFALVGETGLETYTEPFTHKSATLRFRTRTLGLPIPPALGMYHLHVDTRSEGSSEWHRDSALWPLAIVEHNPKPVVTH